MRSVNTDYSHARRNAIRDKHLDQREVIEVNVAAGRLGIALTLDPATCMAVVEDDEKHLTSKAKSLLAEALRSPDLDPNPRRL